MAGQQAGLGKQHKAAVRRPRAECFSLSRLRSFTICRNLLWMFYQSVVASVLSYAVVCSGGNISKAGKADQDSRFCGRHGAGLSGESGREKDTNQTAGHSGQCQSAHCHQQPEKHVQRQAALPKEQSRTPGHQTVQLLTGLEERAQKNGSTEDREEQSVS